MAFWKTKFQSLKDQSHNNVSSGSQSSFTSPKNNWVCRRAFWPGPHFDLVPLAKHPQSITRLVQLTSKRFISAAEDGSMSIWDVASGQLVVMLKGGHERRITAMVPMREPGSRSVTRMVTASLDKKVIVWDLVKGLPLLHTVEKTQVVWSICYLSDLDLIISGGASLCLWSSNGVLIDRIEDMFEGEDIKFLLNISGNRIVCAYNKYLTVYCVETLKENSSDNDLGDDTSLYDDDLYDSDPSNHKRSESSSVFTTVACSHEEASSNGVVQLSHVKKLPHHSEVVRFLQEVGESAFLSASLDGCITLWTCRSLTPTKFFNQHRCYHDESNQFTFSIESIAVVDQRLLLAGVGNGFAIFDTSSKFPLIDIRDAHETKVSTIAYIRWLDLMVTGGLDGRIRFWGFIEETVLSASSNFGNSGAMKSNRTGGARDIAGNMQLHLQQPEPITRAPQLSSVISLTDKLFLQAPLSELTSAAHLQSQQTGDGNGRYRMVCFHELIGHADKVTQIINCEERGLLSCGKESFVFYWRNRIFLQNQLMEHLSTRFPV